MSVPYRSDRRGEVYENPVTRERSVALTDPADHPERVLVAHLFVEPGGRVAAPHRHATITERFHVLSGRVGFRLGDEERELGPGEEAEVPPQMLHDWWQVGDEPAEVLVEVAPGDRFIEMVGTMFGLARDGKTDRRGLPKPLQLAVSAQAYRDTVEFAFPPPALQKLIFAPLAAIGRARGLKPYYEEYMHSDEVVEPDPRALALLDENGRLRRSQPGPPAAT